MIHENIFNDTDIIKKTYGHADRINFLARQRGRN